MYNFMKWRKVYLLISLVVIVPGLFTLFRYGLKPSVDFTGGTLLEFQVSGESNVSNDQINTIFTNQQLEIGSIQSSGDRSYIARLKQIDNVQKEQLLASMSASFGLTKELRFETVGPTLGKELLQKTFIASLIAISGILLYVAWAFKNIRYGVSAIVALIHDVLVVLGIFAILGQWKGIEVDSLFVTAVLTTMSFSVHDTIVVFDRIRELAKKHSGMSFELLINQALSETMVRSLNNSLTIMFMLLALVLLGGDSIRWFAVALLIGTITGTYSSPFVATPVLFFLNQLQKHRKKF